MKIAVVCPDGVSVLLFLKGMIKELKKIPGARITVLSSDGIYKKEIEELGVRSASIAMYRFMNPLKDIKYLLELHRIFKREQFDAVINVSTKPNIYGTIAAKLSNVDKVLCSVWGRGSVFVERDSLRQILVKLSLLSSYWLAFRLSSKVWFTNKNDFDYFSSRHIVKSQKAFLTKNYVSTEEYFPYVLTEPELSYFRKEFGLNDSDKVVIMVGRMIWAKGVKEFVEASKILKDKLPMVKFILVGPEEKGSWDAVPSSYLKESERSGNFYWVGFRSDVKDLYALADLAVLPSYYKEGGFPRALTEPMAMGKPLIAANTVDCRSPVEEGKNGYLVPIKNSKALAEAIEKLIKDDEKMKAFGQYSRLKAEKELEETLIVRQVLNEFL